MIWTCNRRYQLSLIMIGCFFILFLASGLGEVQADQDLAKALWETSFRNKSANNVLSDAKIIDKFVLVPLSERTKRLDSCLAAIMIHHLGIEPHLSCSFSSSFIVLDTIRQRIYQEYINAERYDKASTDMIRRDLAKVIKKPLEKARADSKQAYENMDTMVKARVRQGKARKLSLDKYDAKMLFITPGVRKAFLMHIYLKRNGNNIPRAVHNYCQTHFMQTTVEEKSNVRIKHIVKALDNNIPVLLNAQSNQPLVIIGYVDKKNTVTLLAYNPQNTKTKDTPAHELLTDETKQNQHPFAQKMIKNLENRTHVNDHAISLSDPLPLGVEIYTLTGTDSAVFIHPFTADPPRLWNQISSKLF